MKEIYQKLDLAESKIFAYRKNLELQTKEDGKAFGNKLFYLIKDIETLKEFGSIILKDSAIELLEKCRNKIQELKNELKDLIERETLLGM